jgi:hypothetical protein
MNPSSTLIFLRPVWKDALTTRADVGRIRAPKWGKPTAVARAIGLILMISKGLSYFTRGVGAGWLLFQGAFTRIKAPLRRLLPFQSILLSLVLCGSQTLTVASSADELYSQVATADDRGDVQEIARLIKDGESLWSNNPTPYLNLQILAAGRLKTSNPTVTATIFDNVMEKTSPPDAIYACNYFLKKTAFIQNILRPYSISINQQRLLQLARYLGEIRTNMIPGYVIRQEVRNKIENQWGWYNNGLHSMHKLPPTIPAPETNTTYQSIKAAETLQCLLKLANNSITPLLLNSCSHFSLRNQTNIDLTKQICSAAHLTDEECKRMMAAN